MPSASPSEIKVTARQLLRRWLEREGDPAATIDGLGREAIRAAAQAASRLERGAVAAESASGILESLQKLGDAQLPKPRRRLPFGWGSRKPAPQSPDYGALIASLERERDMVAHTLITLKSDMARLNEAEGGLGDALELIRACQAAIEAAARELARERPDQAAFLTGTIGPHLLERERDVLTQQTVTNQGVLTLQVIAQGHEAIGKAIDRARDTSVAALRTAVAARQAIAGNKDLLVQAEALERTADAARTAPATSDAVERAMADALQQVRRAIEAAKVAPRNF